MSQNIDDLTKKWPDAAGILQMLDAAEGSHFLDPAAPTVLTRAPCRLDVMGGIADYSGSLVLQFPLREATWIALQIDDAPVLNIESRGEKRKGDAAVFTMPLDDLGNGGVPISYEAARAHFQRDPDRSWAAYVAGAFVVLMREKGVVFPHGARMTIQSNVPEGKGVASSAALEVAAMRALDTAYSIHLESRQLALLCQKVENLVVGAPCGIMDQMTAVFGEAHQLLALLCQPAEIEGTVAVPEELALWGIDSGIAHAVSGADYRSVRAGAFMGYRILQEIAETNWGGYLANLTPSELERQYLDQLPEEMLGAEFLDRYGETTDSATGVDPHLTYRVRQATSHPVYEHSRLRTFQLLFEENPVSNAPLLGELMFQSHASYSACGLGSKGTDRLVELARAAGASQGIYGAKITGGGSGGTVAVLARRDAEATARSIAKTYGEETGYHPYFFCGSSSGAASFGHWRLGF